MTDDGMKYQKDQIIQVTDTDLCNLVGATLQIRDVRDWGVIASMVMPSKGIAYFRVKYGQFCYIGESAMIPNDDQKD